MATRKRGPDDDPSDAAQTPAARIKPNSWSSPGPIGNTTGLVVPETAPNPHFDSAPPIKPTEPEKGWWTSWGSNVLHTGLDAVGLVPGFGEVADGANALIYLAEGDKVNAAISAVAMIPGLGAGATATKYGKKVAEAGAEALGKTAGREAAGQKAAKEAEERAAREAEEAAAKKTTDKGNPEGGKVDGSRQFKGKCGEWLAKMDLFDAGYTEIMEVQNKSGHGIDVMARNPNGDIKVLEVKTTDGTTAPSLKGDQAKLGGEGFTNSRLGRAANGRGHYKNSPDAIANGAKGLEWLLEAQELGKKVDYEKYDVFIDDPEKGCIKKKAITNPWDIVEKKKKKK